MIMLFRLLAILCLFFNVSSYAVDCYQDQNKGPILIQKAMPPFKIPQNAQPGQKIWESDDISVHVFVTMLVTGQRPHRRRRFTPG